jgi:hypothetical protein
MRAHKFYFFLLFIKCDEYKDEHCMLKHCIKKKTEGTSEKHKRIVTVHEMHLRSVLHGIDIHRVILDVTASACNGGERRKKLF